MSLTAYLPQDRLRALVRGQILPERTSGSAMLADISGFTPLTEGLQQSLGPRQGAEELTRHLNTVFIALIGVLEQFGGSVLGFAGDAISCWFDQADGDPAPRAAAAAFAMQSAMKAFAVIELPNETTAALTLKVAIASGPARRFVVGDPSVQYIDVLAGTTVERTSTGENLANAGEILMDEASVQALGSTLTTHEWRSDIDRGERFAVAAKLITTVPSRSLPAILPLPPLNMLQAWLPYAIAKREQPGQTGLMTEFRPCVALFVRFGGIDFDSDDAQVELDAFISGLQTTAEYYEGALINLTIGDKGSYAYLNFGALAAHEDDARRAIKAALDVRATSHLTLQIGIAQGLMHVGAYGGQTRKTFGALGDDVNLAARLMTTADEGQILVSGPVHKATRSDFSFEPKAPLPMKGKAEPLPVFAVTGERRQRAVRLQEPTYALPMVGREQELKEIETKLDLTAEDQGQVIGIVAEAGLGKSRLVAEVIRSARREGFVGYGGACQSDGIHTPYLAWKSIWGALFDVDPDMPERRLVRLLEGEIEELAPERVNAMPLLNAVLDLHLPENDFTRNLAPKIRQSALHALLEDCLKSAAQYEPTLIVIEDLHWIDALSHDLLEQLAKALANHAVCFVLAYRPPQMERLLVPRLEALSQFTRIELHDLTRAEAESAIRAKLAQLYPARGGALPDGLVEALMARAQGNPFYLEELLNYVHDRGLDPSDLNQIELPDSLHTLILSRIDQLAEQEKATLRVASIIGRLFRAQWLTGYYPDLGHFPQVKAALDTLEKLDITPLDSPEPELSYLFKHIVTHEVTYESLPFSTRARLHEQLARYLESMDMSVDTIAFHYGRSENQEKLREYLRKAGESAQKRFANDAALEYYSQLLPLLKDEMEQTQIRMQRGQVLELLGKYDEAESDYRAAQELAKNNAALRAKAQFAIGKLFRLNGDYDRALARLTEAYETWDSIEKHKGIERVLVEKGFVHIRRGEFDDALRSLTEGMELAREIEDKQGMASALNHLGIVANIQGDYTKGQKLFEESLVLRIEIGDKQGAAKSLMNLGLSAAEQSDLVKARSFYTDSLALAREIGDKWAISAALTNLGLLVVQQGQFSEAGDLLGKSLALMREIGDKYGIAASLNSLGNLALEEGDPSRAQALFEESLDLRRETNDKRGIYESLNNLGLVAYNEGHNTDALSLLEQSLEIANSLRDKRGGAAVLFNMGLVALAQASEPISTMFFKARQWFKESLELRLEIGDRIGVINCFVGFSRIALIRGDTNLAVKLSGAADALLNTLQAKMDVDVRSLHSQTILTAQAALSEEAFNDAWDEGKDFNLDEATALVLELAET